MERKRKGKAMSRHWMLLPALFLCFGQFLHAQSNSGLLQQYIQSEDLLRSTGIMRVKELKEYYALTNYTYSWIGEESDYNRQILVKLLEDAAKEGLNRQDYQPEFIDSLSTKPAILKTGI